MPASDNLIRVARALVPIHEHRFVFAGASILPLLIDDPAAPPPRFTEDVDAVVDVISYGRWETLQRRLHECGLRVRADIPAGRARICLFHLEEIEVDIMPLHTPEILRPSPMLELGFQFAEPFQIANDLEVFALSAPSLLSAKLEAFFERGIRQLPNSKDLDDIVALFDGRMRLVDEIADATPEMRVFISDGLRRFLANGYVLDLISDAIRNPEHERRILAKMRQAI